jgi:hypothetical protein
LEVLLHVPHGGFCRSEIDLGRLESLFRLHAVESLLRDHRVGLGAGVSTARRGTNGTNVTNEYSYSSGTLAR